VTPTLLYDGRCRFCRFAARAIVRLDRSGTLTVLPFDDPDARPLLAAVPAAERVTTWQLVQEGRRASGGTGLAELVGLLPLTRPLAPALRRLPLPAIYEAISRRRGRLGRLVPDGPAPRRHAR
jgi:predicted DCC family thiol-disulfide oxidoreductase YuxK